MVALSFWLFRGVWRSPDRLVYGGQDALLFDWFLGWTPHALGAGINPLYTHALGPPAGVNLMWNTPVPLLGALSAPLTALAGPVVSFNFWVTMGPALSGFACYLALRRWTRVVPATVGGLLYGFCPVVIGQSGHINLDVAVFPPLALMLLDDLLVRQHHPKRSAALLGLACAAQLMVSSEVLLTTVLIAVVGLLLLAILHRGRLPVALSAAAQRLGVTAAVAVPLAAGPLAVQFLGAQRPVGPLHATGVSVSDLWTPLVPTPFQRFSTPAMLRVSHRFTSNAVEVGGYLGLPLLIALVAVVIWRWRDPLVRWAALTGLVAMVLSFGPRLHSRVT